MTWLIFNSQFLAEQAQAKIALEMGLGKPGMVTTRWADPKMTKAGKWAIPSNGEGASEPVWPDYAP